MIFKKILVGIFITGLLSGCAQNAALLGPAYTLATTGNIYNAGLTYSGNEIVKKATGKSTAQNLSETFSSKKKDKDTDFQKLVKKNIKNTRKKLNLSNQ
jgi:hypothetical protein|tara:strand:- start:424 stop:720 length:297 start_codon:yes stop_codon:yes gene_type:complete